MSIQVKQIDKHFGQFHALNNINLEFPDGELVALLGPSGCGKTTLLRIIAGLETADSGQVLLQGEDATNTHVRKRQVGFVFQHYALFRHMTVFENIAFGLRVRPRKHRPSEQVIKQKVNNLLELVQLGFLADRFPAQLSGGQRQRIALARALAVEPQVLLLDEPFGALDAKVRKELRRWLRRLHDELHITSIFVTHDQEEALEVADRVVVINKGKIEQIGTPQDVYDHPASQFVYQFLGNVNQFDSHVENGAAKIAGVDFKLDTLSQHQNSPAVAYVRPHDIEIFKQETGTKPNFSAYISYVHAIGPLVRLELQRIDHTELIEAELTQERFRELGLAQGDQVFVYPRNVRVFIDKVA